MSQDEIAVMDGGICILQLRGGGVRPFFLTNMILRNINSIKIYRTMKKIYLI